MGWFAVGTFFATKFILSGFHSDAQPGSLTFIVDRRHLGLRDGLHRREGHPIRRQAVVAI